jgi:hypothetical protein
VGQQVAVDLLADRVRLFGPQDSARPAQVGLELVVAGFVLPPLVVGLGELFGGGLFRVGDGGDQLDQLAVPVSTFR